MIEVLLIASGNVKIQSISILCITELVIHGALYLSGRGGYLEACAQIQDLVSTRLDINNLFGTAMN